MISANQRPNRRILANIPRISQDIYCGDYIISSKYFKGSSISEKLLLTLVALSYQEIVVISSQNLQESHVSHKFISLRSGRREHNVST